MSHVLCMYMYILNIQQVWAHSLDYDWWMPAQGFEYDMVARSFSRYKKNETIHGTASSTCPVPFLDLVPQKKGVCTTLRLGLHAQFSPEFVNSRSYPKPTQEKQNQLTTEITRYASDSASANAVADGDSHAVAVGETLRLLVRVQDRNSGDQTTIKAREDPGLPPGLFATKDDVPGLQSQPTGYIAGLPSYPTRSKLVFPPSFSTSKMLESESAVATCGDGTCQNCKSNYLDKFGQDLSPPSYVDRTFTYMPREQHAGAIFKVCFYAQSNVRHPFDTHISHTF